MYSFLLFKMYSVGRKQYGWKPGITHVCYQPGNVKPAWQELERVRGGGGGDSWN